MQIFIGFDEKRGLLNFDIFTAWLESQVRNIPMKRIWQ